MRILLIEDEPDIAEFLQVSLESEFYTVDIASDGEKGAFMAKTNDYSLLLIDYVLPKQNGEQVVREVRKDNRNIPIIMLTVKTELDNKLNLFNLGVDDYITKPFLFEELLARIRAVLKRPRETQNSVLRIDDMVVNIDKHIVRRSRQDIYLTRKELALLEYMLKNRGKVLARSVIMEHVWDANADPFSNTIESHMMNLRRKINIPNKRPLIHTIPGRGYKIDLRK